MSYGSANDRRVLASTRKSRLASPLYAQHLVLSVKTRHFIESRHFCRAVLYFRANLAHFSRAFNTRALWSIRRVYGSKASRRALLLRADVCLCSPPRSCLSGPPTKKICLFPDGALNSFRWGNGGLAIAASVTW